jgi:type 1 fimbria pilin
MPANSGATFVPNANNTGGTFTWATGKSTGNFQVRFVATNAMQGSASASIQIKAAKARLDGADDAQDRSASRWWRCRRRPRTRPWAR